jgi:hypothetical protein
MEQVVGKAVMDPEFREKLFADPEGAARKAGVVLTPEEIEGLKALDANKFKAIGEDIDQSVAANPWL